MLKIAALLFALLVIGSSSFDLNDLDNLNKKGKYVRIISHFKQVSKYYALKNKTKLYSVSDLMEIGKTLFCACDEDESGGKYEYFPNLMEKLVSIISELIYSFTKIFIFFKKIWIIKK